MKPQQVQSDSALDAFFGFLNTFGKFIAGVGLLILVGCIGAGTYYLYLFSDSKTTADVAKAIQNVGLIEKGLLLGVLMWGVGTTAMYWGETILPILHAVPAAILIGLPFVVPLALGKDGKDTVIGPIYAAFNKQGTIMVAIAAITITVEVILQFKQRVSQGMKADQLKFGKGVKVETNERMNVWMGKCYQLPFCRKFVRERCPIYHSKRTCWKERVGCMCEEQVIQDAMAGKIIPKDALKAAAMIPRNTKLTMSQKAQRCRQCVIYNERQKHKYKLALPVTGVSFVILTVLGWGVLVHIIDLLLFRVDNAAGTVTLSSTPNSAISDYIKSSPIPVEGVLIACFMLLAFAYTLKLLEYLIFKVKL